jgi:hypothetical protein
MFMHFLDWGNVSPEAADVEKKEFYYIYNHDLSTGEKVERSLRFIIGKLNQYDKHLASNPVHIIKFEIRGQG